MEIRKWTCLRANSDITAEVLSEVTNQVHDIDHNSLTAVYATVSELIANIIEHAYPDNFKPLHNIECEIAIGRLNEHTLILTITDFGVTIPRSILNKISKEHKTEANTNTPSDAELISDTVFPKASNTSGRGRGLPSIFDFVSQGTFQSAKIVSRHGILDYTGEKIELTVSSSMISGTLIEIQFNTGEQPDALLEHGEILIAEQFSKSPYGRYTADGNYSGENFLNNLLSPALDKYRTVTVNLDGTFGYGASFLDEAFGGLVRRGHTASSLRGRLNLISTKNFHLPHQIWKFIDEAKKQ
jgi:hypothetical protein